MPTKKPRIMITFNKSVADLLLQMALREKKPVSRIAKELVLEALDRREEVALSKLVEIRDAPEVCRKSHDDAWK